MTPTTTGTPAAPLVAGPPADPPTPDRPPGTAAWQARVGRAGARLLRSRPGDPGWARPALLLLLTATGVLYLWGLGASGWANSFYSAAAQAGSVSWKAFFYGSSDAANSITVDKTPASVWVMALSARIFGVNAWSILVPQALMGIGTVGVLYGTVRRWFSPGAALLSGAVLAVTPVAALMFRFNNPDALLTLLLTLGGYATVRALEQASTRWLVVAAACVGFGFMTKMLQALLVVPAFAVAYLLAAPAPARRRVRQVLLAGLGLLVSAGWWVAVVELVPAAYRPYIGGSQTNSILELALGYNGLGRLTGNETGSVGGGGGGRAGGWGQTGWTRMFGAEVGGQIAWLLPAALILLAAGLWFTRRAPRTDRVRAAFVLWGGWLLVTVAVFSQMQGIFHPYYTVALGPAVGALVGMGTAVLWRSRGQVAAAATLAATLAVTAAWSYLLLARSPEWHPWLRTVVLLAGFGAATALLLASPLATPLTGLTPGRGVRVGAVAAGVGLVAALAGPAAYAVNTAATPHGGAIPSAGPAVTAAGFGRTGGPRGFGGPGGFGGPFGTRVPQGAIPQGAIPQGVPGGGPGGGGGPVGGRGGLLNGSTASAELVALLKQDSGSYTWVAAAVGSNNASGYQLATGDPVMAIGGFNGSDPSPTPAQFQQYVSDGKIHYFIGGGVGMGSNGGSNASQQIAAWVAENFSSTTVGGVTVYDLTGGAPAGIG